MNNETERVYWARPDLSAAGQPSVRAPGAEAKARISRALAPGESASVKPLRKPSAKLPAKPPVRPSGHSAAKPQAKPTVGPSAKPQAKPTAKPPVKPAGKPPRKPLAKPTLAYVLQQVAAKMAPFYKKIAADAAYAKKWSEAVVDSDLDRMERLLKEASPRIGANFPGSNGIGYFIGFPFARPFENYVNGTTIPPGTVQFVFEPDAHRAVAAAVLPLYQSLAADRAFARELAEAIEKNDPEAAAVLVRSKVKARTLKSVAIESQGVALLFRFSFSRYPYRNLLFREDNP